MFYSASAGGFYSTEVHGNNMPGDVVSITAERYQALLVGQTQGKQITAGVSGPVLTDPAAPVVTVPQSVTRFQARAALSRAGLFTTVNSAMVAFPIDDERRLAWEDAQEFRRTSPTMLQMAAALGLNDAALDALFTTAAGIEA